MENFEKLAAGLLIATLLVMGLNAFQISQLKGSTNLITANSVMENKAVESVESKSVKSGSLPDVIPKGVPKIYGVELGVSYDDVSSSNTQKADETISKLGVLDKQLSLGGKDLERYIAVASQMSCEYCCGVDSIIFSNGNAACSCQHSFAMRGLAKYLIKNHGNEYSNDEILEELGKWKTLFFPGAMAEKARILQERGIELNYINLASNKYRGVEN
ncbi:hypothetical protein HYX03_00025 [Candidatus Woesearchaeota archaeon]|nr:hypothetical protein [Candidatus Woesearchaeota archaeon]